MFCFPRWHISLGCLLCFLSLFQIPLSGCGSPGTTNPPGDCTAPNFPGCAQGNQCDPITKSCLCNSKECLQMPNFGCHPIGNLCLEHCSKEEDCTGENIKCVGQEGKKFCQAPLQQCMVDKDCTDPARPYCDTTAEPHACK